MADHTDQFTVLLAMDGSEHAKFAFDWYVKKMHCPGFRVVIVHVVGLHGALHDIDWYSDPSGNDVNTLQKIITDEKAKIIEKLKEFEQYLKDAKIEGLVRSIHAEQPGRGIIQAAEECNARMIITGCRGKGTLRRTLMGSVSDYVVHHASVPTLVCRHPHHHHSHGHHGHGHHDNHHHHGK